MTSKSAKYVVFAFIALGFSAVVAGEAEAQSAVAFITGTKQGVIGGDDVSKLGAGGITVHAIGYALSSPIDSATGQSSGKVQHGPLQLTKVPDKSSPRLITALAGNEVLSNMEIRFYRTASTGTVVHYHTFKLFNARVVSFQTGGDTRAPDGVTETVGFAYQTIEISDLVNKIITQASWY